MASVLIADDHPLFREALALAVKIAGPTITICHAASATAALQQLDLQSDISLLLLDLRMPDSSGYATLLKVRAEHPKLPVVVITAEESDEVAQRCRSYGAAGFLRKSAPLEKMTQLISDVLTGAVSEDYWPLPSPTSSGDEMASRIATLSPTQLKMLMGVLEGRLNKQIAFDLNVSEVTIKAHMTSVFRKLHVINRTQAVLAAQSIGLSPISGMAAE